MKITIFLSAFILLIINFSYGQTSIRNKIECTCKDKNVVFYDAPKFEYNIKSVEIIKRRDGVQSYNDLTEKEKKALIKKAKKLHCCKIVCDFNYEIPSQLKNFDVEKENDKKNYFHFYIVREIKAKE